MFIVCLANLGVKSREVAIVFELRPLWFLKCSDAKPLRRVSPRDTVMGWGLLKLGDWHAWNVGQANFDQPQGMG